MSDSALVSIVKVLEETYTPTGVLFWLNARNKHLDNRTPIELIDFEHYDRVLEVARAIEGVAGLEVSTKPVAPPVVVETSRNPEDLLNDFPD